MVDMTEEHQGYLLLSGGATRGCKSYFRKYKVAVDASFKVRAFRLPLPFSLLALILDSICITQATMSLVVPLYVTLWKIPLNTTNIKIIMNEQDEVLTAQVSLFFFFPSFVSSVAICQWLNYPFFLFSSSYCVDGDIQTIMHISIDFLLLLLVIHPVISNSCNSTASTKIKK